MRGRCTAGRRARPRRGGAAPPSRARARLSRAAEGAAKLFRLTISQNTRNFQICHAVLLRLSVRLFSFAPLSVFSVPCVLRSMQNYTLCFSADSHKMYSCRTCHQKAAPRKLGHPRKKSKKSCRSSSLFAAWAGRRGKKLTGPARRAAAAGVRALGGRGCTAGGRSGRTAVVPVENPARSGRASTSGAPVPIADLLGKIPEATA